MSVERSDDADAEPGEEPTADDADAEAESDETEILDRAEVRCGISLGSNDD